MTTGSVESFNPSDLLLDEYVPHLGVERVVTAFSLTLDAGVPEVDISGGEVLVAASNDFYRVTPDPDTLALTDGTTNYVYLGLDDGIQYHVDTDDSGPGWPAVKVAEVDTSADTTTAIEPPGINLDNAVIVKSSSDLPSPVNGYHKLEARPYFFRGFVTSTAGLELNAGTSPLVGRHGAVDGFIRTDGGTAVKGSSAPFMARDLYLHAPGGTLFDLTADNTTEMLVESISASDAAALGNISSLGTIDGYRVPSFKGCNFEDFDGGFTFDGDPDKIFFSESPFRGVTASNVTIFTIASTCSVGIVDFADNYVKGVQSDTEVWRVETGATVSEVFQYRGTTHDSTVTKSNVLVGQAGPQTVGYRVSDSHPVRDSSTVGEMALNETDPVTTISSSDTWTKLAGATTPGNETERCSNPSDGTLRYDGKRDVNVQVSASLTLESTNGDVVAAAIAKNGTVEPNSEAQAVMSGGGSPQNFTVVGVEDLTTNDEIEIYVKNVSAANDITNVQYNVSLIG